jgi:hypothetical protein
MSCWVLSAGDGVGLQFTIHNDNNNAPFKGPVFIALVYLELGSEAADEVRCGLAFVKLKDLGGLGNDVIGGHAVLDREGSAWGRSTERVNADLRV